MERGGGEGKNDGNEILYVDAGSKCNLTEAAACIASWSCAMSVSMEVLRAASCSALAEALCSMSVRMVERCVVA